MRDLETVIVDIVDIVNGDTSKGHIIDEYFTYDDSINSMIRIADIQYYDIKLSKIQIAPLNELNFSNKKRYKVINIEDLLNQI